MPDYRVRSGRRALTCDREHAFCGRARYVLVLFAMLALAAPASGLTLSDVWGTGVVVHLNGFMYGGSNTVDLPQSTTPMVIYSDTVATAGEGESTAHFAASFAASDAGFEIFIGDDAGVTQTDWSPDPNDPALLVGGVMLGFDAEGPGDLEIRASFTVSGMVPSSGFVEVIAAAATDEFDRLLLEPMCWVAGSCAYQDIASFRIEEPGPFSRDVELAYSVPDAATALEQFYHPRSGVALGIQVQNDGGPASVFVETASVEASAVPEPGAGTLLGAGLLLISLFRRSVVGSKSAPGSERGAP